MAFTKNDLEATKQYDLFEDLSDEESMLKRLHSVRHFIIVNGTKYQVYKVQELLEDYKTELNISRYSKAYIDKIYHTKSKLLLSQITHQLYVDDTKSRNHGSFKNNFISMLIFMVILIVVLITSLNLNQW